MELRTELDQVELKPEGTLHIRWRKCVYNNGKRVFSKYHRSTITPNTDATQQMAQVDLHLMALGFPACEGKDMVLEAAGLLHTAERKKCLYS